MSKWYKIDGLDLPEIESILVEEKDDTVYEKFIIYSDGTSYKVTKPIVFSIGYSYERIEHLKKVYSNIKVEELTSEDVFAIML